MTITIIRSWTGRYEVLFPTGLEFADGPDHAEWLARDYNRQRRIAGCVQLPVQHKQEPTPFCVACHQPVVDDPRQPFAALILVTRKGTAHLCFSCWERSGTTGEW